jgi:predicted ATPase/tetratricopeptide (TPR) repeat protein
VAFKPECDCWIDVAAFESRVGDASSTTDIRHLKQAVELYRGDFLTGFYVLHAPDFEAWMFAEQARLRELAIQAFHTLAGSYNEPQELHTGITYARRLLALEPWREEAHQQLILLLARDGQRGAALAQYDLCRKVLSEELGVEPTAETTKLYEHILAEKTIEPGHRHGISLTDESGELTSKVFSPRSTPPHNLPTQLTPLIGRETEMTALTQLLNDPELRLVTILGPGGIGKTRLAIEIAQAQVPNYPDGVYFVQLAPFNAPTSIVPTLAEAINFSFYENGKPKNQLFDYLRPKQMLLVLDTFEHLLKGTKLILDLLGSTSELKILITSRARLNVQPEQLCPIAGIEVPQQIERYENAINFSGIKLFLQSARRVKPNFDLKPDNVKHVIQICRWVEGMPLGILLAASWLDLLDPAEIATEIGRDPEFLAADLRDLPERQQSLRAVFDHSWRLLAAQEQTVFQQLSIFRGGFTHQAARAVSGASLRELRALVNKSMLTRTPSGRYEMHDLLQQYGLEKLAEDSGQEAAVRNRHSAYFCAVLQQKEVDLKGSRQQAALAELEADTENMRAAWDWAVKQGGANRLAQAVESLCLFYEWRGRYFEGEDACRMAAEKLATAQSLDFHRVLAKVLTWQSVFNQILGKTQRAHQLVQQAQALLDNLDLKGQDTKAEGAFTSLQSGRIEFFTDRKEAKRLFKESLDMYRVINDPWGTANALDRLTEILRLSDDNNQANQLQQESLSIRRSLGDQKGILSALCELAQMAMIQGHFEVVERRQQEIQALLPILNDRISIAYGNFTLGRTLWRTGQFVESRTYLEKSLGTYEELGARMRARLLNLGWQAAILVELGDYDLAILKAQMLLSLGREVGDIDIEGFALNVSGQAESAKENYVKAVPLLQHSLAIFRELGQPNGLGRTWGMLSRCAYGLGDIPRSLNYLAESLRIGLEIRSQIVLNRWAIPLAALHLANIGDYKRAVILHTHTFLDPAVPNSRMAKDIFGQHIAAMTASLPPEELAEAEKQGKALDLWETAAELLAEIEEGRLS